MSCISASAKKIIHPFVLATALSSAFVSVAAQAATVTFSNGDRLSGELLQVDADTLRFSSGMLGEVSIPWDKVQAVVSDEGMNIFRPGQDQDPDNDNQASVEDGNAAIAQTAQQEFAAASQDAEAVAPSQPLLDEAMKYSGQLDVGGTFNRGNSNDDQFSILGELTARTSQRRYTFGLVVNEGRSFGVTTVSNRRLQGQYDAFLNERDFLFVRARAEQDEMADLDLRAALGGGVGRQFIDNEATKLSAQVGVNYVNEAYADGNDQSFPTLSMGLKLDHQFFERRLVYFQYMDVDTSMRDTSDTLLRTRLGLRVPITQGLNVSTQLNHDYANQPAAGKKKSDTALIFSVGYGF